jgi:hypothetical protein
VNLSAYLDKGSRENAVDMATGYGLDGRVLVPVGAKFFSSPRRPDSGAHPVSYPRDIRGSFPGGKAAGA